MLMCCFHCCKLDVKEDVSNDICFKVLHNKKISEKSQKISETLLCILVYQIPRDPRMLCNIREYLSLNNKNNVSIAFSPVFLDHALKAC